MAKKRTPKLLAGYTRHNKVRLVHGGEDYFSTLVRMIDDAKTSIHLQYNILDGDQAGRRVADALARAAHRQVQVFILLDGYASQHLSKQIIREWKEAGVRFRWFWPLLKSRHFYLGRRMHHKVVVVDAALGMAGGINIREPSNDNHRKKTWLHRTLVAGRSGCLTLPI